MRPPARGRDRELRAFAAQAVAQPHDQIARQEGTVARSAENPLRAGPVGRGPIEPGEDFRERSRMVRDPVGDDRQAERREAAGIAIGVESQAFALRLKPRDDAGENRAPADLAQRLVAAAHAPRQSAREHDARRAGA